MARIIEITDLNLPELDIFFRLTEPQLRNRLEPEEGKFIAESPTVIGLALDAGCVPVSLLMERRHAEGKGRDIIRRCGDIPVYVADEETLCTITGYRLNRGILCAMYRPAPLSFRQVIENAHRVAILEGIVDATNVGAIFRSAAAMHMDAVLLSPTCCDPLNRRAARVSMGTVFQIPWARIGQTPAQWPHPGLDWLKELGFHTAALALDDRAVSIEDPGLMAQDRLALILGTEGTGLMQETISACDYTVKIPMSHHVDSLNVAAASAVAFWQLRYKA